MKSILSIAFLFWASLSFAQTEEKEEALPSKESQAYHEYRSQITRPPYNLNKIEDLIVKIKSDDESESLKSSVYNSLTLREKFTYHMIHGESYSQNCDGFFPVVDENKKIFANLPDAFGEYNWSSRQKDFFESYRDSVIFLLSESIKRAKRVGLNYKQAVIEINAIEMIPLLISTYNLSKKDGDLLTVLLLLMKENKFTPFINSPSYTKLYGKTANYYAFINFNKENEALVIKRATDFYNASKK
ncbi:MAG: hypothetical protein QM764_17130 [Chitinophagaceae bacterium]